MIVTWDLRDGVGVGGGGGRKLTITPQHDGYYGNAHMPIGAKSRKSD